jgi:uncharacterized protein
VVNRTHDQLNKLVVPPKPPNNSGDVAAAAVLARLVQLACRYAAVVIFGFLLAVITSSTYFVRNFAIESDSNKLMSSTLPWRQQEAMLDRAFPQRIDRIVAVIDATTPEGADSATDALLKALSARTDLIRTVSRPDGGDFFEREGILFRSVAEVRHDMADLISAQPFLGTLAADPSLRGILRTLSQSLDGVRLGKAKLDELRPALTSIGDALQSQMNGKPAPFSWRTLIRGRAAKPSELRHFLNIQPVLNFSDLQSGSRATAVIRETAANLGLTPERGVRVRLTGSVAISDDEFAVIGEGAAVNGAVTLLLVVFVLWLALKKTRLIVAVFLNLIAGLVLTAAAGLLMVGAFNPISVTFAVLFVGIGVDFSIQFAVRYRSERHDWHDLDKALASTAHGIAGPLTLAAAAIVTAFYSFLPSAYVGLAELGLIAGTGILIAFVTTLTFLPALLKVLSPSAEQKPIGYPALAPLDRFLDRRSKWIVGVTLAITIAGTPLLADLRFDFNPLNLWSQDSESIATLLDLMNDPDTSPNTIEILKSNLAEAVPVAQRLEQLPQVGRVLTLQSFVPEDQDAKLALIEDASFFFENTLNPAEIEPAPTHPEIVAAIQKLIPELNEAVQGRTGETAVAARRLANVLAALTQAPATELDRAQWLLVTPLQTTLRQVRRLLTAAPFDLASLPPELKSNWISADGRARIEVAPAGASNDNVVLSSFVTAVQTIEPNAAGKPVFMIEAAATMVKAFVEAGVLSVVTMAIILFIALRRFTDVALTLVPLLVAIVVTLEISVLIGPQLNFANIIALPLLLGVGVAFKIYYVVAWRSGGTNFLQSSLTRAILFSACTTAIAFGSLWFSHHPGTSSMGKLMALALVTTLAAAVIFQPALIATQRTGRRRDQIDRMKSWREKKPFSDRKR